MAMPWIYAIRIVQWIFGLIVLALTAYVVSTWDWWGESDTANFVLFLSCWTLIVAIPYLALAPTHAPRLAHRMVIPAMEVITMIFWFAGFIATAAELPDSHACHWSACRSRQAATVFGAFEWLLFALTTFFAVVDFMNGRSSGETAQKTQHNAHLGV
ncbi:hypothetical protein N7493_009900 [Penicillium malachiteum]|uniref:MARVEL domain-containing protein n=1 Tax=Penicillium malachiteum TaxID=1324776 RepID=A0AAD6HDM5_9EURO|nr:hypothetical protein N7493_009900 [Penicillium malachiteum]